MERNGAMLRAVFAWIEPIIIGLVTGWQWLVLLGLCNLFIIILRYNNENSQSKQSPLSHNMFSYKSQLQNLRTQNNYFWAISFLSIVVWVITYVIVTWDVYTKVALSLMITGIVYRIIAAATHGFKHTWGQIVSKIFAALLVVSTWWAFLWSNNGQTFLADLPTKIADLITIPKAMAPSWWSNVKLVNNIWTGTTNTWEQTQPVVTWAVQPDTTLETQPNTTERNNTTALTFAQVVPVLVDKFKLPVPSWSINFTNIASNSSIYNAFKAWYAARFFGPSINPSSTVSCNVYFVMLWLAQKWDVNYTSSTIFTAYRAEAEKRWQLYWCEAWKNITEANLPY